MNGFREALIDGKVLKSTTGTTKWRLNQSSSKMEYWDGAKWEYHEVFGTIDEFNPENMDIYGWQIEGIEILKKQEERGETVNGFREALVSGKSIKSLISTAVWRLNSKTQRMEYLDNERWNETGTIPDLETFDPESLDTDQWQITGVKKLPTEEALERIDQMLSKKTVLDGFWKFAGYEFSEKYFEDSMKIIKRALKGEHVK